MTKVLDDLIVQHGLMSEVLIDLGVTLPIAVPDYKVGDKVWCVPWLATDIYGEISPNNPDDKNAVEGEVVSRHYRFNTESIGFWVYKIRHSYKGNSLYRFYYHAATVSPVPMPAPKARVGSKVAVRGPGGWALQIVREMQWSYPPNAPDQPYWSYTTTAPEKGSPFAYTGIQEDRFDLIKDKAEWL